MSRQDWAIATPVTIDFPVDRRPDWAIATPVGIDWIGID
jgi:hypothetical protein